MVPKSHYFFENLSKFHHFGTLYTWLPAKALNQPRQPAANQPRSLVIINNYAPHASRHASRLTRFTGGQVQKVLYNTRAALFLYDTRLLFCCTRFARTANAHTRTGKRACRTRIVNNYSAAVAVIFAGS